LTEGPDEMDPKADALRETAKRFLQGGRIVEHGSLHNPMAGSRHNRQLYEPKPGWHEVGKLT
jgi:hypothetical protein